MGRPERRLRRAAALVLRLLVLSAVVVGVVGVARSAIRPAPAPRPGSEQAQAATNPVRLENARPGTTSWDIPLAPRGAIEGYGSSPSVTPGSALTLHVNTAPAARYRVSVYRLGWYGGRGARLVDCGAPCEGSRQGVERASGQTDAAGEPRAGWPATEHLTIGPDWVSGYYVATLVLVDGPNRGKGANVPFIVLAPPSRQSTILVQAAVNTWQAYNSWGGKSLYTFNSSGGIAATRVSFERPILEGVLNYPLTWEYPLVRFLEREGYDVAYLTDVDTHRDPTELQRHRLVMTAGHGEYWTKEMRDGFENALAAGTNLMFMGANTGYWQIRYDRSERSILSYRTVTSDPAIDPAIKTVRFRDLPAPRAECELLGVQSQGGLAAAGDPPRSYQPAVVAMGDPWFAGTNLTTSSVLFDLVGYEWDVVHPDCNTPTLTVLFHYEGAPSNADAVRYTAPSGARVFSSGTLQFSWGLDDWGRPGHASPGLQQFMRNALLDLTA